MSDSVIVGLAVKHDRDIKSNTNVMQEQCLITFVNTFRERLIQAREDRKLTQQQLSDLSGVKQSAIGNYESGLRKSSREVVALARVLKVRPEWLQHGKGPMREVVPEESARDEQRASKWPFPRVDLAKMTGLSATELGRLEAIILFNANLLGIDIEDRGVSKE